MGINPASIGFTTLTMESDKYVCIREKVTSSGSEQNQVIIVDLNDTDNIIRRPITADSAIMNPERNILALKAGRQVQIFNVEMKAKIKSHMMDQEIVFWKWISADKIGIVGTSIVYHWNLEGNGSPYKVFDRAQNMSGSQIINYKVDPEEKWMLIVGIIAQEGRVAGAMQLYSKDKTSSQAIEGHAGAFAQITTMAQSSVKIFSFASRTPSGAKLHVVEIDHPETTPVTFVKRAVDIYFPAESSADFPVAMQISSKYNVIYLITKLGYIHIYDIESGVCIFMNRISSDTIFVTSEYTVSSGIMGVNRKGQVLSISIDEDNIIHFLRESLKNNEIALRMAIKNGLPGANDLVSAKFRVLLQQNNYSEAVKVAASSPGGFLRTPETIELLKQAHSTPGQLSPILQYFGLLLEKGDLNKYESIELAKPVIAQGRKPLLEKWLKEDKLDCSEELGDLVRQLDVTLALSIYLRGNVSPKVIQCFAETEQYDKIFLYAEKMNYKPDYLAIFKAVAAVNPEASVDFAKMLVSHPQGPLISNQQVFDIYLGLNAIPQATAFMLDVLKEDKPEEAALQTKVLEINLIHAPQVADAILGNEIFSHYDQAHIARLCERAGLHQRALEHYSDIYDIKRTLAQTHLLRPDWIVEYFSKLTVEQSLECLREMLQSNLRQNLPVAVQIATKYSDMLGAANLIELFESFKSSDGLYYYLGGVVNASEDPNVHFKYIQAACKTGQLKEVERMCRDSQFLDGEKVKNFLKEAKLPDQLPLVIICDRFDFVHDLVLYLYQNNQQKYIDIFVQKVNSEKTPQVIGALLDVDCDDTTIRNLLVSVTGPFSIDALVEEVERRNRIKIILPYLENRLRSQSDDPSVFNALAKIYVDSNSNAEQFLKENDQYDPLVVGQYCERKNPYLAFIAYEKGSCDAPILALTSDNAMFKQQARYVVHRKDAELWRTVLSAENECRRSLIDQVVATALMESRDAEEVSLAVKAFMAADLPNELIELLEKIVLDSSMFSDNKNLQNLLILTAIKAEHSKVGEYIERLNNFDAAEIASIAVQNEMYEEAFLVQDKFGHTVEAMQILVDHLQDLDRAHAYAEKKPKPDVYSLLGRAYLAAGNVREAIAAYIKAQDPSNHGDVTAAAYRGECYEELVTYLLMAKNKIREPAIENELFFAYAKTNRLQDLENALSSGNVVAQVQVVGDRCFAEKLYKAARLLFLHVSNFSKLAITMAHLKEYNAAIDFAKKANSVRVWRELNLACLDQDEFRLAQACGLHLITHPEELDELVRLYEYRGYFDEIVQLLEAGLGLEKAHMGIFTDLAILYSKHKPAKLMEHLKIYWSKMNVPKTIRVVDDAHQWRELVFLYSHYDEYDNAINTMLGHSAVAWDHDIYKNVILKVSNLELLYKSLRFYLDEHPLLLNELLNVLTPKIDLAKVVSMFRKSSHVPLIKSYLLNVQQTNHPAVNNALIDLYIEEGNWNALKASITHYDNFDGLSLATKLQDHDSLEFRRIAAYLYRSNRKWKQSLALSIKDRLFKDALETAAESNDAETAETLLRDFIQAGDTEHVLSCLYICYDLLRPDVVMELTWKNNISNLTMPYLCQVMNKTLKRLEKVETELSTLKAKDAELEDSIQGMQKIDLGVNPMSMQNPMMLGQGQPQLMITGSQPLQPGYYPSY